MYRCFSACLTPCDVLTVKSRAERIETPLLILTAGYFLDASYIAVDDERVICIIDNKTGFCAFWFFNMFFLYIIDFDFFAASHSLPASSNVRSGSSSPFVFTITCDPGACFA